MKREMTLSDAVGRIAWGYVFLHFHLNINAFDLVPDWVCYAMVLTALPALGRVRRSALLLRPLAIGLCAWEAFNWVTAVSIGALELTASVVGLYFHFQLLTDLASIGEELNYPGTKKLLNLRTGRTVIATALSLPLGITLEGVWAMIPLAAMLVIMIWTVAVLFALRNYLRKIQIWAD